jgi:hypothetical protein
MTTTYEVHLAIYDLSRGMARSLSGQFLGPDHALDIIPHTGIVVYGKEYFYGGGIQSVNPTSFRQNMGIFPIDIQVLGRTTVTQQEFEQWCHNCMQTKRWSMEAYDLMQRNCNNFSQEAAIEGLRLTNGVPEWILEVPRRFLASPMGQMVRPMLEQMQMTGGGGGSAVPFADAAPPVTAPSMDTNVNPWANIPTTSSASAAAASTQSRGSVKAELQTPLLDSFQRPLLSNDTKTASLCANKLIANTESESSKIALQEIGEKLSGGGKPCEELVEAASMAILAQLQENSNITFALMLLRLVVLHPPQKLVDTSSYNQCLEWVQTQLSHNVALQTPAARSMAWCTLSNAYGTAATSPITYLESVVEAAMRDIVPDSCVEGVRQAAAAFLYNVSLVEGPRAEHTEELPDLVVSMLCGCLDGVSLETNVTTKMRRLLVAARIVKPCGSVNASAKSLVMDLGFGDALHELAASSTTKGTGDANKFQKLATEFIAILES